MYAFSILIFLGSEGGGEAEAEARRGAAARPRALGVGDAFNDRGEGLYFGGAYISVVFGLVVAGLIFRCRPYLSVPQFLV